MPKIRKVTVFDAYHPTTGEYVGCGSQAWADGFPEFWSEDGKPRFEHRTVFVAGLTSEQVTAFRAGRFCEGLSILNP